jgi:hypothetical protein
MSWLFLWAGSLSVLWLSALSYCGCTVVVHLHWYVLCLQALARVASNSMAYVPKCPPGVL